MKNLKEMIYETPEMKITCEDNMQLMARYPDNYFDLAVVDPPYGLKRLSSKTDDKNNRFSLKKADKFNNNKPTNQYWNELFRVSRNQIVWGANNFIMPPSEYFCIWNKHQTVSNFASAEYAWVSMGLKTPAKVYDYSIHRHNQTKKIHSTQKPISLYSWVFKTYAKPNQKILDTHLGSGSISLSIHEINDIEKMNLHLTACEIDDGFYFDAIQRIKNSTNQLTIFS